MHRAVAREEHGAIQIDGGGMRRLLLPATALAMLPLALMAQPAAAAAGTTQRVSISNTERQANDASFTNATSEPVISADGRYVVFTSRATNLVAGDTGFEDVFVRDRVRGSTIRASVSSGGAEANGNSGDPSISADGRYVVFSSFATNLVPGDTNDTADVFLRDLASATTTRVSVSDTGRQANGISFEPSISADGRYVAFSSVATNLVAGDTNAEGDVFVRDRMAGRTTRVSVSNTERQATKLSGQPSISGDGRFVAFSSAAPNLVQADTNNSLDVFVRDRVGGTTVRVSVSGTGRQGNNASDTPAMSRGGHDVAFESLATNLVGGDTNRSSDVFVRDLRRSTTTRVSVSSSETQASLGSYEPSINADGRYVAFYSIAPDLIPRDTNNTSDIFVRDRAAGTTTRVSVSSSEVQSNNSSSDPSLSASGRYVVFESDATNLVPGDTNNARDVFVRDRGGYAY